jgi:hypothetical protein
LIWKFIAVAAFATTTTSHAWKRYLVLATRAAVRPVLIVPFALGRSALRYLYVVASESCPPLRTIPTPSAVTREPPSMLSSATLPR